MGRLGGRLALGVMVGLLLALAPAAGAAAAPSGTLVVSGLAVERGVVRFVLTARDLPLGATLDPAAVRVSVGETELRSEAELLSEVGATTSLAGVPPRALMIVVVANGTVSDADLSVAQSTADAVLSALPPDVAAGVVVTGKAAAATPPDRDRGAARQALDAVRATGTASVLDGVEAALSALATAGYDAQSHRRILVISDGGDATPSPTDPRLADMVTPAQVPVDVVAIRASATGVAGLTAMTNLAAGVLLRAKDATTASESGTLLAHGFSPVVAVTAYVPSQLGGAPARLDVTVAATDRSAPGTDLSVSTPVTFGPALAPPPAPAPSGLSWVPPWAAYAVAIMVFVAVVVGAVAVAWPRSRKQARIRQIAHFGPARTAKAAPRSEPESTTNLIARTALAATASVMRSGGMERRIALRLTRAGMRLRPPEWVLLRACVSLGLSALLFTFAELPGAVIGLVLGWLLTTLYQSVRIERRATSFAEQLPDAIQLMIGSLRSGFSLPQALESLVRESPEPVSAEFGRALAEHRLGADISDALERVGQRTRSDDLGWAVMAVRIQREVGGNLAEVLQTTVDTMRERARLRRQVRSLTAEGRLSAWVLIALPVGLATFMFVYRSDYVAPLITNGVGRMMLLVGILLLVLGIVWMSRLVKVDS